MFPVEVLLLSQDDIVNTGVTMKQVLDVVESVFQEHGLGYFDNPPKPAIHPQKDAFIHAMPGFLTRKKAVGIKWVSGYSNNYRIGLPNIMGIIVLNDMESGKPLAILDGSFITALRTAAVSGVSAKYLSKEAANTIGVIGAGVQGRYHLIALHEILPNITQIKIFDTDSQIMKRLISQYAQNLPFEIMPAKSIQEAIGGSDIIVTATGKLEHTLFYERWIKPGALVLPIHMFGWESQIIAKLDRFVVDDWEQFSTYFQKVGNVYDPIPTPHAELGEIVAKIKQGRSDNHERIINFNLGIALHDIAVASTVYRKAKKIGIGTSWRMMSAEPPGTI